MKEQFPFFKANPNTAYLDSAATTQRLGRALMNAHLFDVDGNASPHGSSKLARQALALYEQCRANVAEFINAELEEVVFTKNATEGLNLLAACLRSKHRVAFAEIASHNSAMLPWIAADYEVRPIVPTVARPKGSVVCISGAGNVVGAIPNLTKIVPEIRALFRESIVVLDATQLAPHRLLDVKTLGVDFLVFSGHKLYGPFGTGVLWGRKELLEKLEPWQVGGGMVESVEGLANPATRPPPHRFEAGTQNVSGAIGLATAVGWFKENFAEIHCNEVELVAQVEERFKADFPEIMVVEKEATSTKIPLWSFVAPWAHPHDLGTIFDDKGVVIRTGKHCADLLHKALDLEATSRISLGAYTDQGDIDRFFEALGAARDFFAKPLQ